jgi:hypothetical protein
MAFIMVLFSIITITVITTQEEEWPTMTSSQTDPTDIHTLRTDAMVVARKHAADAWDDKHTSAADTVEERQSVSMPMWGLLFVFKSRDGEDATLFTERAVKEMRGVVDLVTSYEGYEDYCYRVLNTKGDYEVGGWTELRL